MKPEMQVELLQPWSTFVMKTQLPSLILEKMIKITDEIIENRTDRGDDPGAGQLENQFYIEFLSEHCLFGTIILLSILFFLIFRILGVIIKSKNYIQAGCFIYILTNFIPLLPSGSFFSDFNATIFWINFSLMYACNKQTNIFYEQDLKLKTT